MPKELLHIKAFISDSEKAIDEANHSILFTIPEIVDRDDEIVTAQAIYDAIGDRKNFASNPICLPCHQHRLEGGQPPCVGSWDVESAKKLANSVNVELKFAIGTKLGDEYWNCYKAKHMRAISIGFRALDRSMEDRKGRQVRIISKIDLYEISCVAVGCNPGALSKLKSMFGWDEKQNEEVENLIKQIVAAEVEAKLADIRSEIEDVKLLVTPDSDDFAEKLLLGDNDSEPVISRVDDTNSESSLSKILNIMQNYTF